MHDYHMNFLASDRQQQLRAEADRARLGASLHRHDSPATPTRPRRPFRLSLNGLLRRTA